MSRHAFLSLLQAVIHACARAMRNQINVYCDSMKTSLTRKSYTNASHAYIRIRTRNICEMPVIIAGILQGEIPECILSDITLPAHTQHMASVT